MDKKIVSKVNIRRAVLGTCVVLVADGGGGARPRKVTITLLRRRGCWRALSSRRVAVFAFPEASGHISVPAPLDLEYLFRCSGKADAAAMQIKICVAYCRGATRKARVSLEEFLEALLHGGRPGSFHLYIYEDKVGLLQASEQFQALPTTWPLEQKTGKEKATDTDTDDATYNEWKLYLEEVFSVKDDEQNTDNDDTTYNERKVYLEEVFSVKDDEQNTDNDDTTYNERKVYLEEVFSVKDDEVNTDNEDATYNEWKLYLEKVFSVDDDEENTDNNDDAYSDRNVLPGDVFAVENNDLDEPVHEAGEGTCIDGTASHEGVHELLEVFGDAATKEEEVSGAAAAREETPELGEAPGSAAAEEDVPEVGEASRSSQSATDREVSLQGDAPSPAVVSAASATASHAYRSLTVPHRFMARLAGPSICLLEDLQVSHDVSIVQVRRTLHIKGHRDAVLQCHRHIRGEIAEWRRQEAADAAKAQ
ncbi:uncharacterized protein LOC127008145 isoform X2 [Eriocheir sinensis]|uniref:uncharacterized protein LOC127008145 isoform X2 n=1 Tax=Eriocheir sinensis TaxID=95602 RepID=UPI0021C7054E|nr:uncharacterized protein LOC127008145 isoform X2 [Eriocheir sinensis]